MNDASLQPAIPAATLVLFHAAADGPPLLLMLERAGSMAFAPGALVFPGGRVDPGDAALAADEEGRAKVAAIRETIEEAGIAVGLDPLPDAATVDALRRGLAEGAPFAGLLARHGLAVAPGRLVPFARWRPNFREMRAFDTRFFLAEAPPGAAVTVDGAECVTAHWDTAAALLAAAAGGHHRLVFPTRRNLERLARFASFAEACADARRHPPRLIVPAVEERDDGPWLTIPADMGYPVTAEPLAVAARR